MSIELVFLAVAVLLQLAAIFLALRLIKTTGASEVWLILAGALAMMLLQRLILMAGITLPGASPRVLPEFVTMATSLLILLSLFSIQALFRRIRQDEENLRESERRYQSVAEENARLLEETRQAALRQRLFMREILSIVTEGRLCLSEEPVDLPAPLAPMGEPLPVTSASLEALRHRAAEAANFVEMPAERRDDLILAVGEAAMNAVVHAGGGVARVSADEARGVVQIRIEDAGKGIALDQLHRATLERGYTTSGTMGHGFWMMLKTADRIWLMTTSAGTTVILEQERALREDPVWGDEDIDALLASLP